MTWPSLLPPLLAIAIAIWKKEVILALLAAILCAELLLSNLHPGLGFIATIDRIVSVFDSRSNTEILLFSVLIGALLNLIRQSGGVSAFVHYLLQKNLATSPRRVGLMTTSLGIFIFIESNLSVLASGIFAQSLFDRFRMSRGGLRARPAGWLRTGEPASGHALQHPDELLCHPDPVPGPVHGMEQPGLVFTCPP